MKSPAEYTLELVKSKTPSMSYDGKEDFALWQKRARTKLASLLGMDRINPANDDGFKIEYVREEEKFIDTRFVINGEEGYAFPLVLRVPKGASGKLPLFVCVQGHSTGMHISLGQVKYPKTDVTFIENEHCNYAAEAVERGFAAVTVEMRNFGEMGADPENGAPMCHIATMNNILMGRTTIGERANDISRAIDAVLAHFDVVDPEKIMLMGISGGGTATYYTAALDERISLAVSIGAVCTYDSSISSIRHCVCNFVPGIVNYFGIGDIGGLIAPRKLVAVNGRLDKIFPDYGVREAYERVSELYSAAGVPESCTLVTGESGHICYPDITWPAIYKMLGITE
jgi:hypothetical protein